MQRRDGVRRPSPGPSSLRKTLKQWAQWVTSRWNWTPPSVPATRPAASRNAVSSPMRRAGSPVQLSAASEDRELHARRLEELCGGPRDAAGRAGRRHRRSRPSRGRPSSRRAGARARPRSAAHARRSAGTPPNGLPRSAVDSRARAAAASTAPASTSVRRRSTSLSSTSISKGQARTHAAHVVQDQASSGLTRLSSGRPSRIAWSVDWTTRRGSSGLPAAVAGHTAVHRPHRTHVAASSSWAQVSRWGSSGAGSASGGGEPARRSELAQGELHRRRDHVAEDRRCRSGRRAPSRARRAWSRARGGAGRPPGRPPPP